VGLSAERDLDLASLIPTERAQETHLVSSAVRSVTSLIHEQRVHPDVRRFKAQAQALRDNETRTLVVRLATMSDPLLLWAAHLVLDAREVPPLLRWPANQDNEQALFITWCADLFWLCKRHPGHRARFRGWQALFKNAPGSPAWHASAHRQFLFVASRYSLSHWCSKGLDLTDSDRALLMTLPTNKMRADRRVLEGERYGQLNQLLLNHAVTRPDKARKRTPHETADRRAAMWRTYILAGRNQTLAALQWTELTGEQITRQAFAKQTAIAADVLRLASRGLIS
jgi:hypothetical protein